MADSPVFQFQTESINTGGVGASGQAPRLGVEGGTGSNNAGARLYADTDVQVHTKIPDFLEAAFAPKLETLRRNAMLKGFTEAAAGRSINEIQAEQPWYSQLFGPTPHAAGAEMFSAQKATAEFESNLVSRMPELRKMNPAEFGTEISGMISGMLTGELFTDALIQKNVMDRALPLVDMHTKAHVMWQQEDLIARQFETDKSVAQAYQNSATAYGKLGTQNPNDPAAASARVDIKRTFLTDMQSGEFQNDESKRARYRNIINHAKDTGQWYVLSALGEAGIEKIFDPEEQIKLATAVQTAHVKFKGNWVTTSPENTQELTRIKAMVQLGGLNGAGVVEAMDSFNARYKAETGSPFDYWDTGDKVDYATTATVARMRKEERLQERALDRSERAAEEHAKEAAKVETETALITAAATGAIGDERYTDVPEADKQRALTTMFDRYMAPKTPEAIQQAAGMLVHNYNHKNATVATKVQQRIQADFDKMPPDAVTKTFLANYELWKAMRVSKGWKFNETTRKGEQTRASVGPAATEVYFGAMNKKMLEFYNRVENNGDELIVAYALSFGERIEMGDLRGQDREQSTQNLKDFTAAYEKLQPGTWDQIFGDKNTMNSSARNLFYRVASQEFGQDDSLEGSVRAEAAMQTAINVRGVDYAGQHAWLNLGTSKPLYQFLGAQSRQSAAPFIEATINRKLQDSEIDINDDTIQYQNFRLADENGKAKLLIVATTETERKVAYVTSDEIQETFKQRLKKQVVPVRDPKVLRAEDYRNEL